MYKCKSYEIVSRDFNDRLRNWSANSATVHQSSYSIDFFEKKHVFSQEIKKDVSEENLFYLGDIRNFERNNTKTVKHCIETVSSTDSKI